MSAWNASFPASGASGSTLLDRAEQGAELLERPEGFRNLSSCQSRINACPKRALRLSFDLDALGSERLRLKGEPCARLRPALPRAA